MSALDKTETVSIRFRVQWRYTGVWGLGRRLARWIHLRLQQIKLKSRFAKLSHDATGDLRIHIEEVVLDNAERGGFVISMSGDSWAMGKYLKAILNEPADQCDQALLSIIQADLGDLLLATTPVETELDVESYSVGGNPGEPAPGFG